MGFLRLWGCKDLTRLFVNSYRSNIGCLGASVTSSQAPASKTNRREGEMIPGVFSRHQAAACGLDFSSALMALVTCTG
jgi:hypothetical protein